MKRQSGIFLFTLFLHGILCAQQFGGFPPSTRWQQINTDTVRLIYTPGAGSQANRIASLVLRAAADTPFALGGQLRKVNIVLHSRTTLANGYVSLAPFRSEFYLIPGGNVYDFGNISWYESLAIHEYRHVQQYNNFRNGLSRFFYYIFGERGLSLATNASVPDWFYEGDAVHSETALTPQGRGRQPFFLSGYNSLWLEGKHYSWQKLRNGSLKDYVPNHYQLGYLLVNYGYLKYGNDFWEKVTHDASAFRGLFYPFQQAVKRYTGLSYKNFRNEALAYYRSRFDSTRLIMLHKDPTVTDYYYPQYLGADSLLYLKTSYRKLPAFYVRQGSKEHRVARRFISGEDWFSQRGGQVAYTAYSTHPRWSLVDYSDIVLLDLSSGRQRTLTHKQRYFTPDIAPSGERIAAVRITDSLETELQVLSTEDGRVIQSIRGGADEYYTNPRFLDENRILAGVRSRDARMSLQAYDLVKKQWSELLPYRFYSISVPYVRGDTVLFTANISENDDLFALTLADGRLYRLTQKQTGTYFPSARDNRLAYAQFMANGLKLQEQALDNALWIPVSEAELNAHATFFPVAGPRNLLTTPTRQWTGQRYSKSTGLFNFHSWSPDYVDPEFTFTLYGDNVLGTFSNQLYYRYNQNERSHGVGYVASYGGLYPVLNLGLENTFSRHLYTATDIFTFNSFEARAGYNIPLNFSRGRMYKVLNFGSNFVYNRTDPTGPFKDSLRSVHTTYLHHFLTWSHYLPRAVQHIYPKFGYALSTAYRHQLDQSGYQAVGVAQVFLPSFGNHSIVLDAAFQETDTNNTVFSNRFAFSRGYTDRYFSRMWRLGANYHFPILYPDFGIASIVYFQRVRGNLFYDYTRVFSADKSQSRNLRSFGGEFYFDTRWWNQQPVSFGFRISHLLDNGFGRSDSKGGTWLEFILPVNLIPD